MLANAIYLLALGAVFPLVVFRAIRHGRYRRGVSAKLFGLSRKEANRLAGDSSRCLWLHAVSVGEVNLLVTFVDQLRQQRPDLRCVISTSTDAGFDLARERFGADRVFFCPLDFSWAVRRTIRRLQPVGLVLAELELWPNLIRIAAKQCPVTVINGRLSERSARGYQRFGLFLRQTFARLTWVGCQDQLSAERFADCGAKRVDVTGSIKFDGAPSDRDSHHVQSRLLWSATAPWHRVWCVGSTQASEEDMALAIYQRLAQAHLDLRLVLVPRHPERFDAVAEQIQAKGFQVRRRSELATTSETIRQPAWSSQTVLLIDTVGELKHWWGVAQIATVGGSFGDRGGQNMLEPAGYGCAVSFGPNTKNFQDIAERLIRAEGAIRVADEHALEQFVLRCLNSPPAADALGRAAKTFVRTQQGATQLSITEILGLLPGENAAASSPTVKQAA